MHLITRYYSRYSCSNSRF